MIYTDTIDELDVKKITKSSFRQHFFDKNKPVVIKGLLKDTIADKSWTIENLKNRIGDYPIKVFNLNDKNGTSYLFPKHIMKLKEMFLLIENNSKSDYRMFVNTILKKDKKLQNELPTPTFFKCKFQLPNLLFIGGKDCIVPLHYDFIKDNGLLTQFYGRKEIILLDQSQSELLYRLPLNSISMVNLFDPDYKTYPALRKVKGIKTILNHGDTLFIPSGYWHQIKYLDASMSVAFRKWNSNPFKTFALGFSLVTKVLVDKTLNFLIPFRWLKFKQALAKKRAEK